MSIENSSNQSFNVRTARALESLDQLEASALMLQFNAGYSSARAGEILGVPAAQASELAISGLFHLRQQVFSGEVHQPSLDARSRSLASLAIEQDNILRSV